MSEEIEGWHIREIDGQERKWVKEDREQAIEDYDEFAGEDFVGTIEVVDPEGRIVKSMTEQTDTEELQERVDAEVIDMTAEENKPGTSETEPSESEPTRGNKGKTQLEPAPGGENAPTPTENAVPQPSQLTSDPLDVISKNAEQFTDEIKGKTTINRQGYAVLAERFNIEVEAHPVTLPSETDFEYAEFRAVAITEDGQRYSGFGSAKKSRGDDTDVLAELAETRAMKRATAWATGVGMTAVSELENTIPDK